MNAHGKTPPRPRIAPPAGLTAAALLATLLSGCSPSGERALVEGDRLLQAGRAAEAVPLLERAVQDLPQNAPALNHLGLAYHATGRTNDARRAYLRALEVDRNRIEATHNLAISHLERGEWLEAERGFRAYLVAHPGDAAVLETLAQLQFQAGRWDDAERSFAAIQPAEAISADGWNTRGLLTLRKRRFKDAAKCFQYAFSLAPASTTPLYNLGVTHQLQGDRRSAAAQYRLWLAANAGAPQAAAVQELIRQWEAPVATPTSVTNAAVNLTGTGSPSVAGSAAGSAAKTPRPASPAARTNTVAEAARVPTVPAPVAPTSTAVPPKAAEPKPTVASTAAPAAPVAAPRITAPPPPLQVVEVSEDPPLKPAQAEPAPTPTVPTGQPPKAVAVVPAATNPATVTTSPAASPTVAAAPPGATSDGAAEDSGTPGKRSLWQRVTPGKWANPVQWFRKDPAATTNLVAPSTAPAPAGKAAKKPTPLSPPLAAPATATPAPAAPATAATTKGTAAAPRPPATPTRRPAPPRYVRKAPGLLPAGNRAAAEPHFVQGTSAQQRRDLVSAAAHYRRATEVDPSFHEAYHNLALVAMDQGDLSLALLACEQALQLRPSDAETRRNFAAALKAAQYPQDAAEQLELFLAARPTDTALHLAAAGLYAGELDEPAKARTHYEAVLALEPSHPQGPAIRGWLSAHPR
jgi:Flp pilus assembly protein TadD